MAIRFEDKSAAKRSETTKAVSVEAAKPAPDVAVPDGELSLGQVDKPAPKPKRRAK